ncbi:MAG TPA: LytTR family DNA-binding domain-containing protein [Bacteroidales bacterium]|nr:LytTR family DNA-binding domain-containing protein [Bacteroidales bacterium]
MKVLVIENEKPALERIIRLLNSIDSSATVVAVIETVEESVNWFHGNPQPDLILMDIQLDDGLCFEIFENVNIEVPVIFTTAFDEYTLRAFKVNSIDYLLKPVTVEALKAALDKYHKLYSGKTPVKYDIEKLIRELSGRYKQRFLIRSGPKYRSVAVHDISYIHITEKSVFLKDFSGREYALDYSLDHVQELLDPAKFYRINRDCIVNIESISQMTSYSSSRLQLTLKTEKDSGIFVVSRDKVGDFKRWIDR